MKQQPELKPREEEETEDPREIRHVQVRAPGNPEERKVIDKLAVYVSEDGHLFEEELLRRGVEGNSLLDFMRKKNSEEATYYRWKVFSLLEPSQQHSDVRIFKHGAIWEPLAEVMSRKYVPIGNTS